MAQPATLFRFKIELSDIDRGVYESLDFRLARHPSESNTYLMTRVLAFALSYQEGLEFSPQGLSDPEVPAMRALGPNGNFSLWVEIGNPSPRKLHKASKMAGLVRIYTYKDPQSLVRNLASEKIHKAEEIEIFSIDGKFLDGVEKLLERENKWSILYQDKHLTLNIGDISQQTEVRTWSI